MSESVTPERLERLEAVAHAARLFNNRRAFPVQMTDYTLATESALRELAQTLVVLDQSYEDEQEAAIFMCKKCREVWIDPHFTCKCLADENQWEYVGRAFPTPPEAYDPFRDQPPGLVYTRAAVLEIIEKERYTEPPSSTDRQDQTTWNDGWNAALARIADRLTSE